MDIAGNANKTGGEPAISDAYTINGQPGYLYPCSKPGRSSNFKSSTHAHNLLSNVNGTNTIIFSLPSGIKQTHLQ